MGEIVYLHVCCFKRPFDDATVERVRLEAESVAAILDAARAGAFALVRSSAHDFENERNPREDRRLATRLWLDAATASVTATERERLHVEVLRPDQVPLETSGDDR